MTKTRQYRTDEETLQALAGEHPVIGLILEYRGVKKLVSTYVEALPQLVNRVTGRIHTSYNQAVTATGRLSSTNPNLQNIPIRDEQGRAIRRAFVPSAPDRVLVSADYSQVELRIMAHLSGDEAMIEAFRSGEDIHRDTAARIFGVAPTHVTPEQRRRAKTANFGIIYGISAFGLSQRLGIPRTEASEIIAGYFRSYPGVRAYMDRVSMDARERGYVETIFGRRRYLEGIDSANGTVRGLAERNAINAPIQGSAADVMKIAMIRIFRGLRERRLASRMILQVHDEVVIDTLRSEQAEVEALVREAMEGAAALAVPLTVDIGAGDNWLSAH
jgi:DNA polymerase-1